MTQQLPLYRNRGMSYGPGDLYKTGDNSIAYTSRLAKGGGVLERNIVSEQWL